MSFRRRTQFPGVDPRAVQELVDLQADLARDIEGLRVEAIGQTTDTKQSGAYPVRYNERVRCFAGAAGLDLNFAAATSRTQNKWIEVLKLGGGDVRCRATSGTVQGAALLTLTTPGFYYFQSDGVDGWWIQPIGGGGGGEDWAATLAIGNTSGANSPSIDAGQRLDIAGGGLAGGDVRGATALTLTATAGLAQLRADANVAAIVGQAGAIVQGTAGGIAIQTVGANSIRMLTNSVERYEIEGTGALQVNGVVGAAGEVLTSNGPGTPPSWQAASGASLAQAKLIASMRG